MEGRGELALVTKMKTCYNIKYSHSIFVIYGDLLLKFS